MERITINPRKNWQTTVESQGLLYHTPNSQTYWNEAACYKFRAGEIDMLEKATNELQDMCLKAGQFIIDNNRFGDLHIPPAAIPLIQKTWEAEPPSLYGRFDLAYDGKNPPKLLEYNADTPTALLEAAVIQWYWLQDTYPNADQFNSIHEKLIAKWKDIRPYLKGLTLYFGFVDDMEDAMTISYLRETAEQAEIKTEAFLMKEMGWNEAYQNFRAPNENPLYSFFKLYPWEWILQEYPERVLKTYDSTDWIEPIWKMLWSNKGLLAILWELYPHHPYLLETHFASPQSLRYYAKKPLLSREGANISLITQEDRIETTGNYGTEGYVYQALATIPNFGNNYPVIGSWIITDQGAAGIGVRESNTLITDNLSRFVPHYFE